MTVFMIFLLSYLLGSIPFGLIFTRMAGLGDIRNIGSGNIGATNVLRTGNKKIAAATLLCDGAKGAVAVLIVHSIDPTMESLAALGALLGHLFPVWLKFRGGKGVATGIGVVAALSLPCGLAVGATWLIMAKLFRYSSLSALVAIGLTPIDALLFGRADLIPFFVILAFLIIAKHHENIRRLMNGTEPKIGDKKKKDAPSTNTP